MGPMISIAKVGLGVLRIADELQTALPAFGLNAQLRIDSYWSAGE